MEKKSKLNSKKLMIIIAAVFLVCVAALGVLVYSQNRVKQVASEEDYGYVNPDETKAEPDAGITIDGVLDEKEYQDNNWLYMRNDNGNATVDIAMTSYYGEKGMYFVYDVTESTPIYVNLNRSSTFNSCVEMYLALSDVTSMDSSEIFEIDLLPTGDMVFKQRNGKGAFMDVATTSDKMAHLGATTKGGEINTEDCYGYCLEFFIPWDYLDFLGLDVKTMKTDYVFVNTAHITSYNYAGTAETDRYWYSFAQQLGGNGWGNVSLYYRFNEDGVIGTVPVELVQGDHYTIEGVDRVIPGVKTHVEITPEEGYAINSILVNGEEYIKKVSYNEDGSISLDVRGVKEGLKISASAEAVTEGNKTLSGTVKLHKVGGDSLKGVTASYVGPNGEKPITIDSKGNFTLTDLKQGFYTITVEKTGYEKIERGIYLNRNIDTELVLEYLTFEVESGRCWQLEYVNDGIINKMGGFGSLLTTDSYKNFSVEANFKYYEDVAESLDEQDRLEQRQGIRIKFSNDKYWHIDLLYQNEKYFIQYAKATTDSIFNFRDIYVLSEEEVAKFKSEDGIQLKVVREGNRAIIYLGGNLVAVEDLDKTYANLTAKVGFESWGPYTDVRSMEYKITSDAGVDVDALYFGYHKNWDVTKQFEGVVTQPNGGNTVWLRFYEKLANMDLTFRVKDNPKVDGEAPRTSIRFEFDNGETFIASICESANGVVQIQKFPCTYTNNKWAGSYYNFTESEEAQYKTEEGIDFRVVRNGTEILFFIGGEYKTSVDLSEIIKGDTPAIVSIQHVDDQGVPYEMPFTISEKVEEVTITQKESAGKQHKTEKGTTVIVSAEEGYYIKAISLNGKDVSEGLSMDGTYVFTAKEENYTIKATLAKRIFETAYGWDLLKQNQGTKDGVTTGSVTLPEGGTTSSNLNFIEKYADMDLTWRVKDHPDSDASNTTAPRTSFEFIFDEVLTGEKKTFTLSVSDSNKGVVQIQNTSGLRDKAYTSYYNFDEDETAKYRSAEGVDVRIVRDGTDFILFVDGELKAVVDLSKYIKADTKATVRINHNDDNGVELEMPYAVTDKVDIGKIYFGYHKAWDVTNQFEGSVEQPKGGNTVWLRFFDKIATMDLNIKVLDNPKSDKTVPSTNVRFEFDNDETFLVGIGVNSGDGTIHLWNQKSTSNEKVKSLYKLSAAEQAQYETKEGIDFRVVRSGTDILFFIDGEYKTSVDLSEFIEGDIPAIVSIQHHGDEGVPYVMPFTLSEKADAVTITQKESAGKEYKTEKGTTVVVSAEEGYYIKKLSLNGKDVSEGLTWDGRYVFVAEETNYTMKATLAKRIFDTGYGWDLLEQNQGTKDGVTTGSVVLPEGGTTSSNLNFIEKYADMDLTWRVKDHPDSDAANTTAPRTSFEFIFDEVLTGENKTFTLSVSDSNKGVVQIQNISGLKDKAYTSYYNFDEDETAKYRSADGVDVRIVRDGTDFILFVDRELKAVIDLSEYIKADTKATVRINHNDDNGVEIKMPYAVTDKVDIDKIYFGYHKAWDVTNQFEGSVEQPNGGNTVWLRFFDKIASMDLNIKVLDNPKVNEGAPSTNIRFEFDNGETFLVSIGEDSNTGKVHLWNQKSTTNKKTASLCVFGDAEQAQYDTDTGIDFRVVRNGTDILFFVGNEYKTSIDLAEFIETDTLAIVSIQHYGDQGVPYVMPFTLSEELENVTIETGANDGKQLVTDKKKYIVGQVVNVEAEEGYYIKKITVNGKDDSTNLSLHGTYTFTATESKYKLEATVVKKVFGYAAIWNLLNQNTGTNADGATTGFVTLPEGGSGGGGGYLYFNDKYTDMDLTWRVMDHPGSASDNTTPPRTTFEFVFDEVLTGENKIFALSVSDSNKGVVQIQNLYGMKDKEYSSYYNLNEAETGKYRSEEGIDVRIVRNGTEFILFVDGVYKTSIDLSEYIKADTAVTARLTHSDDKGVEIKMPFAVNGKLEKVTITTEANDNKQLITDEESYVVGQVVNVEAEDGYFIKQIFVNDKDVSEDLNLHGTYTFTAKENNYAIKAVVAPKVFGYAAKWNLLKQNEGTDENGAIVGSITLPEGGSGGGGGYLYFNDKYTDMDLTWRVMDHPGSASDNTTPPRTTFEFVFDEVLTGENKIFALSVSDSNKGVVQIQNVHGMKDKEYSSYYDMNVAEIEKYRSEDGIDVRIVRNGTDFVLFVDGVYKTSIDLSEYIKADTAVTVRLAHFDDKGVEIKMPFAVNDTLNPIEVTEKKNDIGSLKVLFAYNGTVVAEEDELKNSAHYLSAIKVDDEEVPLNIDGRITVSVADDAHTVDGVYKKAVFEKSNDWSLVNQNQGTVNGVTSGTLSIKNGGYAGVLYLYRTTNPTGDKGFDYGDIDYTLKLRDYAVGAGTPSTQIRFVFEVAGGQKVLDLYVDESEDVVRIRNAQHSTMPIGSRTLYEFKEEEEVLYKGEGIDVRVLREGKKISIYIGGEFKKSIDLTGHIENESKSRVALFHDGDSGVQVDIPYTLSFPEKELMGGQYLSILGDEISMSTGKPENSENNTTTSVNNTANIYGAGRNFGVGSDWTKLYWGHSLVDNNLKLLVNNSASDGLLYTTRNDDASKLAGYLRASELHANTGTLNEKEPDIIYLYMGTSDYMATTDDAAFAEKYKAALDTITETYENAEVFCFTVMPYYRPASGGFPTDNMIKRMEACNNHIRELVSNYEKVTLVDIEDIINSTNFATYYPTITFNCIMPNATAHEAIADVLQDALESQFEMKANITIESSEYGTITTDKTIYDFDETVVVTAPKEEQIKEGYYLDGLMVNGEAKEFDSNGTYSFTAEKVSYVIEGIYKKEIFEDNASWNLSEQNQGTENGVTHGVVTLPGGGDSNTLYLYRSGTAEQRGYDYGDIDLTLTLRDYQKLSPAPRFLIKFTFNVDNSEKVLQLYVDEGGRIRTSQHDTLPIGSNVLYNFTPEESATYRSNGIEVRILREGTKFSFYVGGQFKKSLDLTKYIENGTMSRVGIVHYNDKDVQVDVPYKLSFPEKETLAGKYLSILGDSISMSTGVPKNADGTSTAGNNSTTATNNAVGIYSDTLKLGIGEDWTKLYWGQSLVTNGMKLLVNNSVSTGRLATEANATTLKAGYLRANQLHDNTDGGITNGTKPDIIYVYMGTEDRKQTNCNDFATRFEETLDTISSQYPDAEVFCFTTMAFSNNGQYWGDGTPTTSSPSASSRMVAVNNHIRTIASTYENVTLVDIADIIKDDSTFATYFPNGGTYIEPTVDVHNEIARRLQKALESQFEAVSQ